MQVKQIFSNAKHSAFIVQMPGKTPRNGRFVQRNAKDIARPLPILPKSLVTRQK